MNRNSLLKVIGILLILALLLTGTDAAQAMQPQEVGHTPEPALQQAAGLAADPGPPGQILERLAQDTGDEVLISIRAGTGTASFLRLASGGDLLPASQAKSLPDKAGDFLAAYGGLFGLSDPGAELLPTTTVTDPYGYRHVSYIQVHRGVPVFAAFLRIHFDAAGRLIAANAGTTPSSKVDVTPKLDAAAATELALQAKLAELAGQAQRGGPAFPAIDVANSTLYVYRGGFIQDVPGADYLVYEVEVTGPALRDFFYVDAHSGAIVDRIEGIHTGIQRELHEPSYPNLKWKEGNAFPTAVPAWNDELNGARETYDLYKNISGSAYLSFDGGNAKMITVNLQGDPDCPNAWWDGTATHYCPGVTGDDTVAHEWTHAYTDYTHGLVYAWQSGALNEAYSDIFGEIVDMINGRGLDAPDALRTAGSCSSYGSGSPSQDNSYRWLSGEDDPAFGGAIRDLWNPVCYGDPGKVSDNQYWCSADDNGGVHSNSGVPNHAFALLVDGGTYNGQTISGIGLTKAAHIYWRAMTVYQGPSTTFMGHADALEQSCQDLIGVNLKDLSSGAASGQILTQADCDQVTAGKLAVEFAELPAQCGYGPILDPDAPPLCQNAEDLQVIFAEDWESSGVVPGGWSVGKRNVANPATFDTPDWAIVTDLPGDGSPAPGSSKAMFVEDNPAYGNCQDDIEAGVLWLQSPAITIPADVAAPELAFDHWVATELGWDGGNVKARVDGGAWTLLGADRFEFNSYPGTLNSAGAGNDNPMAGEPAFSGSNEGIGGGSWGQSQVDLAGLAGPGALVELRFEMGLDGCNGDVGWYVDDVQVYACEGGQAITCGNSVLDYAETCDDGNDQPGDGCSATCQVEDGWTCSDPTPGGNAVLDGSFEGGTPNPVWAEESTHFGTPLCDASCGGPAPSDGSWYAWFGGVSSYAAGAVQQDLTIPAAASGMTFDLLVGVCDSANDYLHALIDGQLIYSSAPCTVNGSFQEQDVDVSSFADDGVHRLRFESEAFANNGGNSNFFLDNVAIETAGAPSVCTPASNDEPDIAVSPAGLDSLQLPDTTVTRTLTISNNGSAPLNWEISEHGLPAAAGCPTPENVPWLSVAPDNGSTAAGASSPLEVELDSTGLVPGTYQARFCIASNDPDEALVLAPVEMEVQAPGDAPNLSMPENVPALPFADVDVPLNFTAHGASIASLVFSVDLDETCLNFDDTDSDQDGVPDAVTFSLPAGFDGSVTYDAGDTDGELDFFIADIFPPLASLADGALATIRFQTTCQPVDPEPFIVPVLFSADPAASFGDSAGQSIPGTTTDGSVEILASRPGDCNGDSAVDAGDISALVLEIFDGDGNLPADTPGGSFPGDPTGCDANEDALVDAGDISCTVLLIFDGPGACAAPAVSAASAPPAPKEGERGTAAIPGLVVPPAGPRLRIPGELRSAAGDTVTVPIQFQAGGNEISSLTFSLDYDQANLVFDPADSDGDGLPDAVRLYLPAGFGGSLTFNPGDADGELDFFIADLFTPLAALHDGLLATVTFQVSGGAASSVVGFSAQPLASFGSTVGASVPGTTENGSILICDASTAAADMNCDGLLDLADLLAGAGLWQSGFAGFDVDGDGDMDIADLQRIGSAWSGTR